MDEACWEEWKKKAGEKQQRMCVLLRDRKWDAIPTNPRLSLQRKIGFALFQAPSCLPGVNGFDNNNVGANDMEVDHMEHDRAKATMNSMGYDDGQVEEINQFCNVLLKHAFKIHGDIYISCIFIVAGETHELVPVFKVFHPKRPDRIVTKDWQSGEIKVYRNWNEFKSVLLIVPTESRTLCFPSHGIYDEKGQAGLCYISPQSVDESQCCSALCREMSISEPIFASSNYGIPPQSYHYVYSQNLSLETVTRGRPSQAQSRS